MVIEGDTFYAENNDYSSDWKNIKTIQLLENYNIWKLKNVRNSLEYLCKNYIAFIMNEGKYIKEHGSIYALINILLATLSMPFLAVVKIIKGLKSEFKMRKHKKIYESFKEKNRLQNPNLSEEEIRYQAVLDLKKYLDED